MSPKGGLERVMSLFDNQISVLKLPEFSLPSLPPIPTPLKAEALGSGTLKITKARAMIGYCGKSV